MKLFLLVIGLTLILEGFLPFFLPAAFRRMVAEISQADPKLIRIIGLVAIVAGLVLMYLSKELL